MIRMDLGTKQVFLSGLFAWLLTVGAGVMSYTKLQENHNVRITTLEKSSDLHFSMIQQQADQLSSAENRAAVTTEALMQISKSQDRFTDAFKEINNSVIRTETSIEFIKRQLTTN